METSDLILGHLPDSRMPLIFIGRCAYFIHALREQSLMLAELLCLKCLRGFDTT
jgi:hypothetical protein